MACRTYAAVDRSSATAASSVPLLGVSFFVRGLGAGGVGALGVSAVSLTSAGSEKSNEASASGCESPPRKLKSGEPSSSLSVPDVSLSIDVYSLALSLVFWHLPKKKCRRQVVRICICVE